MADTESHMREARPSDKYGMQLVEKVGELQKKAVSLTHHGNEDSKKEPAGGFDSVPLPAAPPGFTIRITFHRAENLPFSDFGTLSADPYIHATFKTSLPKRHKQDPDLFIRTPTIHRNVNPNWETQWVIAHVPASGFFLKCRLYDEDPADHDDRLGNVHVNVGNIDNAWHGIHEQPYEIKKRMGSKRAYTIRGVASLLKRGVKMSGRVIISIESLGRSPGESGGRCYTVAPLPWQRHHSPLIGRITGTKDDGEEGKDGKKNVGKYNFQAIQMQLSGPVPEPLYHRYVEFKPFVAGMFTDHSLRGRILNRALHHQHARVYNFDSSTLYGVFEKPCIAMTQQFLEFVHYDQGGRIYTYVLSLDGLWRFTETGKEFGIDMLSKHTMHSDVSIYIAFSGEFFVRRLKHPHHENQEPSQSDWTHDIAPPSNDADNDRDQMAGPHSHKNIPKDPSYYELIIDNDSGTYRPNAKLLPLLKAYMEKNLPGLRVATLDSQGDEELMGKLKNEQRDLKHHTGKQITYLQNSSNSSLSSSEEEELNARDEGRKPQNGYKQKMSKMKGHQNHNGNMPGSTLQADKYSRNNGQRNQSMDSDRDSRDYSSSASDDNGPSSVRQSEEDARNRRDSGYENRDLPTLLKRDQNGHLPRPQELDESRGRAEDPKHGEPETGKNKPAGGIVYGQVVSPDGEELNNEHRY